MPSDPFKPVQLGKLTLKNAFIKAATNEGMCENSEPTDRLISFHRRIAEGGTALTTVSYGSVSPDGKTFDQQLYLSPASLKKLSNLTRAVHGAGGRASIQLTHCGFFTNDATKKAALSPSRVFNAYGALTHLRFSKKMNKGDMERIKLDFVRALEGVVHAGFDAAEIHMGHGYLLSQFLSPVTNHRMDSYGGTVTGRARFPLEVFEALRNTAPDFPLLVKLNMDDGLPGGFTLEDCIYVAQRLEDMGCAAIELTGGFTSKSPFYLLRGDIPLSGMVRNAPSYLERLTMRLFGKRIIKGYEFTPNFFLAQALEVRRHVNVPLVYLGGVTSRTDITNAMNAGFEFIGLGRALIHDPEFIHKLERGEIEKSGCNHCNECIVEMYLGGVKCVLNDG